MKLKLTKDYFLEDICFPKVDKLPPEGGMGYSIKGIPAGTILEVEEVKEE